MTDAEQVEAERRVPHSGCCNRFCDYMACDCLEVAMKRHGRTPGKERGPRL